MNLMDARQNDGCGSAQTTRAHQAGQLPQEPGRYAGREIRWRTLTGTRARAVGHPAAARRRDRRNRLRVRPAARRHPWDARGPSGGRRPPERGRVLRPRRPAGHTGTPGSRPADQRPGLTAICDHLAPARSVARSPRVNGWSPARPELELIAELLQGHLLHRLHHGNDVAASPSEEGCTSAGASGAGIAALEGTPFVLRQAAPHAKILPRLDGPFQAGLNDLAATAYGLRLFDLQESGAGVPDREEQLRIFIQTGSAIAPSHQDWAP